MRAAICLSLTVFLGLLLWPGPLPAAPPVQVTITSVPSNAAVYVDGKEQGLRGFSSDAFKVRLSPGPHRVLLELDGYRPLEQTITVARGTQRFAFTLDRAPGKLAVRAPAASDSALGADLFIDGTPAGTVPTEVEVKQGQHLVEVRKAGFKIYSETITLQPAENHTLLVALQPDVRKGAILVSASEGIVFVDGQNRGVPPVVVDDLPEGDHLVEVRASEREAPLWQQRVQVLAGKQTPVVADLKKEPVGGSLLVIAPPGAEVVVDGTQNAAGGQIITGLKPGQHVIQVQGKGYRATTRIVEIEAGKQRVEKVDLEQSDEARGVGRVRLLMVNPVEGAEYFLNGRRIPEEAALAEKGIEVPAGPNVVVVRRPGFGQVTKTVTVQAGASEALSIELRNTGRITVGSTPPGATVVIDGAEAGRTPFAGADVPPGPHLVEVRQGGYQPFSQQVLVQGGEVQAVRADLVPGYGTPGAAPPGGVYALPGYRPEVLTSFAAVTNDPGRFTVDVGGGYPYFAVIGMNVGALRWRGFGLDAGVELRTDIYQTDVGVKARVQFFKAGPIAVGMNTLLIGGGGPRQRNEVTFELGVPVSLLAGRIVQLTARPYLQVYSDRLCPSQDSIVQLAMQSPSDFQALANSPEHSGDRCVGRGDANHPNGYPNAILDAGTGQYQPGNPLYQVNGTPVLDRFTGVRFFIQAVLEIQVTPQVNVFGLIEGAPGQGERQAFTDKFNRIFPIHDFPLYGRGGLTFKFSAL